MRILAAGSLRVVWPQLMAAFQADAVCDFGPAGLLRERIEAGEACDFLLSARARLILMQHGFSEVPNMTHSQNG